MGFLCLICLQGGEDKSIKTVQVGLCKGLPRHSMERHTLQFTRGFSLPPPLPSKEVSLTTLKERGGGKEINLLAQRAAHASLRFPLKHGGRADRFPTSRAPRGSWGTFPGVMLHRASRGTWGRWPASPMPATAPHVLAIWRRHPRPAPGQRLPQPRCNQ